MDINKKFIIRGLFFVLICIPICIAIIALLEKNETKSLNNDLQQKIGLVTSSLNPSDIASLSGSAGDIDTLVYQRLKDQFLDIGNYLKIDGVRWIYAVKLKSENVIFLLDSVDPTDSGYSAPGTKYASPPEALKESFDHPTSFVAGPYTDEYGTYISAYAPLLNQDGSLVAIMVADIDYLPLKQTMSMNRIRMIGISAASVIILLIVYYFIFRILETKRFVALQQKELNESKARIEETLSQLQKEKEMANNKNAELERLNKFMVNRELKMIELKKEIRSLKNI